MTGTSLRCFSKILYVRGLSDWAAGLRAGAERVEGILLFTLLFKIEFNQLVKRSWICFATILLIGLAGPLLNAQKLTDEQERHIQSLLDSSEILKLRNPAASLSFALQALDWLPETGYEKMRISAHLRAANSEKIASNRDASLSHVNQAESLAYAIRDSVLMMRSVFMKATIFGFYDESDSALVYFQRSIDLYRTGYDVYYAANAYTNIAGLFRNIGDTAKAESYYLKGYAISKGDDYAWIFTLSRLISYYSSLGNPKYISYLDTFAMSDFAKKGSAETVAAHFYTFLNLTNATLAEKEKKLQEVFTLSRRQSSPIHQVEFGMKLNDILVEQNKLEESQSLLAELIPIAIGSGNGRMEAEVNRALYENAKALRQPLQALAYLERFSHIHDSLRVEEMQSQIQELNVRFEVAQKDHEIERQNMSLAQARKNRNILFLIIGMLSVMALITYLYFINRIRTARRLRKQEDIIHRQEKEKLVQEKELAQLTASLESQERERTRIARDLHDGLGSLMSGISAQIEDLLSRDPANESYSTLKSKVKETATELRRTSYELMPVTLLRMGLDPALRDLCFNLLVKNGLEPQLELDADLARLNSDQQLIVYRIVQELLHNIVKHAHARHVLVQLYFFENDMTLIVEDDGKGFRMHDTMLSGIGLGSIKSRVDLLGGLLDIASTPGEGTTVTINFSLKKGQAPD